MLKVIKEHEMLGKTLKVYGNWVIPLFLAKDVAEWIEHSNITHMMNTVEDDEKLTYTICNSGQKREMWFLTEDGLYEVLMQSRKPIAKAFKRQVKALLKEVRTTGRFQMAQYSAVAPCQEVTEVESIFRFMADPKGHMQRKMKENVK